MRFPFRRRLPRRGDVLEIPPTPAQRAAWDKPRPRPPVPGYVNPPPRPRCPPPAELLARLATPR